MKKRNIYLIILLSVIVVGVLPHIFSAKKEIESENLEEPYEYFYSMRSYPDKSLDMKAFNKAFENSKIDYQFARFASTNSWQEEGPSNIGGRITCFKIDPTNSNIMFAGCPGGGLFKTIDAGINWIPVFDAQAFLSISCIVFDPTNSNTMYVGTGDPDIPFTTFIGNGVYRSTDGGLSWINLGLNNVGVVTQVIVHPTNANIIYVSAMGTPMQRDFNRGIYKTVNGGTSWSQVLSIDNQTGISDMVMDYTNPSIIYAASWSRIRTNTESFGFSNTTRIYKTVNAGSNWNILSSGLPNTKLARFGICMSKQNPQKLYVSVCDSTYNLKNIYVTTNGGTNFSPVPDYSAASGIFNGFGWYFGKITVKPNDDNDILIAGVEHYRSMDGGASFFINQPAWWNYNPHADIHAIEFKTSTNYVIATDGGLYETFDDGSSWNKIDNIPNTQFYKVNFNPFNADEYSGGAQDNGTVYGGLIFGINNWNKEFGGDGFQPRIDPTDPNNRYCETQNGNIYSSTDGGGSYNNFVGTIDVSDRRNWDMPYIFGGSSSQVMYTGTYRVYKNSNNPFDSWTPISGDLTDGIIYAARFHNISCIDNSILNSNYIYVGTSDGNVWNSLNDGGNWNNLTSTLPNRYVTSVHSSPNVINNVYVTHSGYRDNEYIPHVHKSINNGQAWIDISGDLPQVGVNDLVVLPNFENVLFVATDIGVYYTDNGGVNWMRLGNNMPTIVIWDLEFNQSSNKLIAGTYARGLQTIDITSILQTVKVNEINSIETTDIIIFPNPAVNELTIKSFLMIDKVEIIDARGKLILSEKQKVIDVSSLAKGIYFAKIYTSKGNVVRRFIK